MPGPNRVGNVLISFLIPKDQREKSMCMLDFQDSLFNYQVTLWDTNRFLNPKSFLCIFVNPSKFHREK